MSTLRSLSTPTFCILTLSLILQSKNPHQHHHRQIWSLHSTDPDHITAIFVKICNSGIRAGSCFFLSLLPRLLWMLFRLSNIWVFFLVFPLLPSLTLINPRESLPRVPIAIESSYALCLWPLWLPSCVPVSDATQVNLGQPLRLYRAWKNANTTRQSFEYDEDNASTKWENLFW